MGIGFVRVGIYLFLLTTLYLSTCTWLITVDWAREDYSYAYLIPFIVIYLIFKKRNILVSTDTRLSWIGVAVTSVGLIIYWIGELSCEFFSSYLSLWIIIFGILWTHYGWEKLKAILLPVTLLLTIFPLPYYINTKLTFHLKLISSQLGVFVLQKLGVSAYREGNVIDLGFTQLQVVDACSGLRYLIPLMVLSILAANFVKIAFWKKIVIMISSIPIAIAVNSFRIASVGILYPIWGANAAEGFFHDFSGWLIFMVTLVILLSEIWILNLIFQEDVENKTSIRKPVGRPTQKERRNEKKQSLPKHSRPGVLKPPHYTVTVLFLGTSLFISQSVDFRPKIPISTPFEQFPMQVGAWLGKGRIMETKFVDELDLSDYILVDYQDPSGKTVNFYSAYYQSQQKGESIHSPSTCLPGNGWTFQNSGKKIFPTLYGHASNVSVTRTLMQNRDMKHIMYYWFPCRGRILTNTFQLKIYNFWDALTRRRTDGAVVRLITQIYNDEDVEDAEKRLTALLRELMPILNEFFPR